MALHHKGKKHSKKRNVGLTFEFLTRHIVESVLKGDQKAAAAASALVKRRFRPGTELYREWRLFNAVVKTKGVDETGANAIIRETRDAVRRYDRAKLDREKSLLIRDVNHSLGPAVYEHRVPNYRTYATIQTLFNDWRDTGVPNITRIGDYEHKLQSMLMEASDVPSPLDTQPNPANDALVLKLMVEKLNRRYSKRLTSRQRSLLGSYIVDGPSSSLVRDATHLKEAVLKYIDSYIDGSDTMTMRKLTEVRGVVESFDVSTVDDVKLARLMKLCELHDELAAAEGGENSGR